jgi:hypothetical protein
MMDASGRFHAWAPSSKAHNQRRDGGEAAPVEDRGWRRYTLYTAAEQVDDQGRQSGSTGGGPGPAGHQGSQQQE